MNRWMQRVAVSIVFLGLGTVRLQACGLAWSTPKNHFDGVDEQGFVEYFEKIGELELGKDLKIPLNVSFRSDRETVSPYLGKGWQLPLVESHIVQLDERTFRLVKPDGWFRFLGRNKPTDTTIKGSSNWAGEIRGNAITIWTDCGWKLEYLNAKISAMSNKSYRIDFVRSGSDGTVTEMRCGGVAVLRVERDSMTGEAKVLVYGDKRIGIEMGSRLPVAQGAKGTDRTLKALTLADGSVHQFEHGINKDGRPTLKIATKDKTDRVFTWNAKNRTILSDNDWQYAIKAGASPRDNSAIERKNSKGEMEYWFSGNGREETLTTDGLRTIRSWFTSGKLSGRLRKIEETKDGETKIIVQCTYDEKGQLLREKTPKGLITYQYDEKGNQVGAMRNERSLWTKLYDARGKAIDIFVPKESDPEILKQLAEREKVLLSRVESATQTEEKDEALQELGFFYVHEMRDVEKAKKLAPSISTSLNRFNVLLHAINYDRDLKLVDMVAGYRALLAKFPEKKQLMEELVELRNQEIKDGAIKSI